MKLPAFLYGTYGEVKKNSRRMVTQLRRGVPWVELPDKLGGMIDTRDMPGIIYVSAGAKGFHGEHFFLFMPAVVIEEAGDGRRLPHDAALTLFEPAIATLWGFITKLGPLGAWVFSRGDNMKRFLHASVNYWDEFDAEGERYSTGPSTPERFWSTAPTIHYCLINLGLPKALSYAPLPPGGIRELINLTEARLH